MYTEKIIHTLFGERNFIFQKYLLRFSWILRCSRSHESQTVAGQVGTLIASCKGPTRLLYLANLYPSDFLIRFSSPALISLQNENQQRTEACLSLVINHSYFTVKVQTWNTQQKKKEEQQRQSQQLKLPRGKLSVGSGASLDEIWRRWDKVNSVLAAFFPQFIPKTPKTGSHFMTYPTQIVKADLVKGIQNQ